MYTLSKVEYTCIISCLIVTYARTNVEIRMLIYLECLLFMEFTGINCSIKGMRKYLKKTF